LVNPCAPGGLLVKAVATGSGTLDTVFEDQCFHIEIWVVDTTHQKQGITCAYVDVDLGEAGCPLVVDGWTIAGDFPDNHRGYLDPTKAESRVLDLGGCTVEKGVGTDGYVLLATIDVVAPQIACMDADVVVAQSAMTASSIWGKGKAYAAPDLGASVGDIDVECWGNLYEHSDNIYINAGDLSMFATAWPPEGTYDPEYDYDCDGVVGPGDLAYAATAWLKDVCGGGILIPDCQINCGGGAALLKEADGTVRWVDAPEWASPEMIMDFGLTLPPRDWEGWRLAPADNGRLTKDRKVRDVRGR
jgi:hypothetical protein